MEAFRDIALLLLPSLNFQSAEPRIHDETLTRWHQQASSQYSQIIELIYTTLYERFSLRNIDSLGASKAYRALLTELAVTQGDRLVFATTNYDPLVEAALSRLGMAPDSGEAPVVEPGHETELRVRGILEGIPRFVPVLHLHGKIGWFSRTDPQPGVHALPDASYNPGFGVPVIKLPDPAKVYNDDEVISAIWAEFESALSRAKRVFVLGHSLNDTLLVSAIIQHVSPLERVAIGLLADESKPSEFSGLAGPTIELMVARMGLATPVPVLFREQPIIGRQALSDWKERVEKLG